MNKFKVGDRVKVVKDFQFFTLSDGKIGDMGVVRQVFEGIPNPYGVELSSKKFSGHNISTLISTNKGYYFPADCLELANTVTKVKLAKPKPVKYAVVSETFSDEKELRKYLKANKGKVLDVYKVRNKVDYKISEYLTLKGE